MRKIFVVFSILLLFIAALANAPPVVYDTDNSQSENITQNIVDQPDMILEVVTIEIDQVALPLVFDMSSCLEVTLTVNPGTLDVNLYANTSLDATQGIIWNSKTSQDTYTWQCYPSWLSLADNTNPELFSESEVLGTGDYTTTYYSI